MRYKPTGSDYELHAIIETKLAAMMTELADGDWSMEEVALATRDVLKSNWVDKIEALQAARGDVPQNFVSDGNEG